MLFQGGRFIDYSVKDVSSDDYHTFRMYYPSVVNETFKTEIRERTDNNEWLIGVMTFSGHGLNWPIDIIDSEDFYGVILWRDYSSDSSVSWIDFMHGKENIDQDIICKACRHLVLLVKGMHEKRFYHYAELIPEKIDTKTGEIILNNFEAVNRMKTGVIGSAKYEAPEVVCGEDNASENTDLYKLALAIFLLCMRWHPLEGKVWESCKCMDSNIINRIYGTDPIFIFDPDNDLNRPSKEIEDELVYRWKSYPLFFRELFVKSFTVGLKNAASRITTDEWIDAIWKLRSHIRNQKSVEQQGNGLREIVERYPGIWKERRRLKALLMDYYVENRVLRNVLYMCVEEEIPHKMEHMESVSAIDFYRLVKLLMESHGCTEEIAKQSVEMWAYALNTDIDYN